MCQIIKLREILPQSIISSKTLTKFFSNNNQEVLLAFLCHFLDQFKLSQILKKYLLWLLFYDLVFHSFYILILTGDKNFSANQDRFYHK